MKINFYLYNNLRFKKQLTVYLVKFTYSEEVYFDMRAAQHQSFTRIIYHNMRINNIYLYIYTPEKYVCVF